MHKHTSMTASWHRDLCICLTLWVCVKQKQLLVPTWISGNWIYLMYLLYLKALILIILHIFQSTQTLKQICTTDLTYSSLALNRQCKPSVTHRKVCWFKSSTGLGLGLLPPCPPARQMKPERKNTKMFLFREQQVNLRRHQHTSKNHSIISY